MLTVLADDWHPTRLFRQGDRGGFWDFHPQFCRQNSDGTGAAAVGQPVGWVRDAIGNAGVKVLLRRRRQRTAETLPKRTEIAALRSRMFVARVPPETSPQQVLEKAGFAEIPKPGP